MFNICVQIRNSPYIMNKIIFQFTHQIMTTRGISFHVSLFCLVLLITLQFYALYSNASHSYVVLVDFSFPLATYIKL